MLEKTPDIHSLGFVDMMQFRRWVSAAFLVMIGTFPVLAQDYRIQTGDILQITVREDQTLDRRVLVRPDGKISLPLAGTLRVTGRTIDQLQAVVTARLRPSFVSPPTVTAALVALAPPELPDIEVPEEAVQNSVYVLGQVERPGRYEYDPEKPINALQALALAGGPGVFAADERIQIRRSVDGKHVVELFSYASIETGDTNAPLRILGDGDVIVVPERGLFD